MSDPRSSDSPSSETQLRRSIELDLDRDALWQLVSDSDQLATWLGDEVEIDLVEGGEGRVRDDDVDRDVVVEQVVEGERIAWRWWRRDEPGAASRVEIVIAPSPAGGRLEITETLIASPATLLARGGSLDAIRWELRATLMAIGAAATCLAR